MLRNNYIHALGNTEEELVRTVLGVAQRGTPADDAFDHSTGAGYVKAHAGQYDDAINVKGNTVLLLISEIFGGVNGTSLRFLTRLAHLAKGADDAPRYDRAGRVVPYFVHHARAISRAAALGHGHVLLKHANALGHRARRLRERPAGGATAAAGDAATGDAAPAAGAEANDDAAMHPADEAREHAREQLRAEARAEEE